MAVRCLIVKFLCRAIGVIDKHRVFSARFAKSLSLRIDRQRLVRTYWGVLGLRNRLRPGRRSHKVLITAFLVYVGKLVFVFSEQLQHSGKYMVTELLHFGHIFYLECVLEKV